jgi:hypothetical protein
MAIQISGTQVVSNAGDLTNIRNIESVSGWTSQEIDSLSGTSVTPNFDAGNNFSLTLSGTTTINNPSNITAGQSGVIVITQASGGYAVSWGSYWDFVDGTAPTIPTTNGSVSIITWFARSTTSLLTTSALGLS